MVKYIIFTFTILVFGCEIKSGQIIKPEKLLLTEIKFNSVSKSLTYLNQSEEPDIINMKKIIKYWFDNKIKTNGFDGSLEIEVNKIDIVNFKEEDYFKVVVNLEIIFTEKTLELERKRKLIIKSSEYGDIKGSFSINDQERLKINTMHKSIQAITDKLKELV